MFQQVIILSDRTYTKRTFRSLVQNYKMDKEKTSLHIDEGGFLDIFNEYYFVK